MFNLTTRPILRPIEISCRSVRSVSTFASIKTVGHHVTRENVMKVAREYGDVLSVRFIKLPSGTTEIRNAQSVQLHFRHINSAKSFVDELDRTVLFGNRSEVVFFNPPPEYFNKTSHFFMKDAQRTNRPDRSLNARQQVPRTTRNARYVRQDELLIPESSLEENDSSRRDSSNETTESGSSNSNNSASSAVESVVKSSDEMSRKNEGELNENQSQPGTTL